MLHVSFPRFVGTAPGTTTFTPNGRRNGVHGALGNAAFPTQAVWVPDPNSDAVKISMPPNQWVTGPMEIHVNVPKHQKSMGPVPNDGQLATMRNYLPLHHGWLNANGEMIYTLQGARGGLGALSTTDKWAIAASVISAVALGTTTVIAIMRYRRDKKRRRR